MVTDAACTSCNTSAVPRLLAGYPGLQWWETCNIHCMNDLVKELYTTFPACEELLRSAQGVVVVAAVKWDNALDSLFATWRSLNLPSTQPAKY